MAARRSYAKSEVSGGLEELPGIRGQGLQLRGATRGPRSVAARRRHPASEFRAAGGSHPVPEARGGGQEEQPDIQGAVAARAQEGLEELIPH